MKKLSLKTKTLNTLRLLFRKEKIENFLINKNQHGYFFSEKLFPSNYLYKNPTKRITSRKGINYSLDISDYMDWLIYFDIKDPSQDLLINICNENDIVVDVGTNIGSTLLNFAKKTFQGNGFVIGFEPDKLNYAKCLANLALNNFANIEVNNFGLGKLKKSVHLVTNSPGNRGGNRVMEIGHDSFIEKEIINITTLDIFIRDKNLKYVNLIKIDVEGYEHEVIQGAKNTLDNYKPTLFIEINNENLKQQGTSARNLISDLEQMHYSIIRADTMEQINSQYDFDKCHFDVLCKYA